MKLHCSSVLVLALGLSPCAFAQAVTPTFDITGVWNSAGGGTAQIFQKGTRVTMVFVGPDFAHRYDGRYNKAQVVQGRQVRVTRASGCTTHGRQRYDVVSADLIRVTLVALDSNCDLVKGQTYTDINTRVW